MSIGSILVIWAGRCGYSIFDLMNPRKRAIASGQERYYLMPRCQKLKKHNIYYQPAVAFDKNGIPWVYFGTGDREDPKDYKNEQERFYAVKDDGLGNNPRDEKKDLKDVTSDNTFTVDATKKGWYIKLEKAGRQLEKVLAKPAVFNRLVYFTTYTYTQSADLWAVAGVSEDYIVEFLSGGGALSVDDLSDLSGTAGARSREIGVGAPSAPVISVNMKGKASLIILTTSGQVFIQEHFLLSLIGKFFIGERAGP